MTQIGSCHVIYGDEIETLSFDWGSVKILSDPEKTDAQRFSFGMVVLEPGKGHQRHNHPDEDEIIFVMSGEGEQMLDDQPPVKVKPGASIYIPKGVFHGTVNTSWEPMRLLVVYAPVGPEVVLRNLPECTVVPAGQTPKR